MELDSIDKKKLKNVVFKQGALVSFRHMNQEAYKRAQTLIVERIYEIEANMGANINYNKDFRDCHRYNKLRTKLIAQRKRQEDRENSERI